MTRAGRARRDVVAGATGTLPRHPAVIARSSSWRIVLPNGEPARPFFAERVAPAPRPHIRIRTESRPR